MPGTEASDNRPNAVFEELYDRIRSGALRAGSRLPSERQLADEFGVSRSQIQMAIVQLSSAGLIDQVPNCRPVVRDRNSLQRPRSTNRRNQVALWIHPNVEDLGASTILKSIRAALGSAGFSAIIGCPDSPDEESEESFLRTLARSTSVAGAIVWTNGGNIGEAYNDLISSNIPVVFVDREPTEEIRADVVSTDNRRAAITAVNHLVKLGHKNILAVLNNERVSSVNDRYQGYLQALSDADLQLRCGPFTLPSGVNSAASEAADQLVKQLITTQDRPSAIFAINDQIAMHLYDAVLENGYSVPKDFSIVGFDWFLRWVPSGGHITTVCQHFEEIGRIAVDRLLERIGRPEPFVPRHVLVDAPLVIKGSTGAYLA